MGQTRVITLINPATVARRLSLFNHLPPPPCRPQLRSSSKTPTSSRLRPRPLSTLTSSIRRLAKSPIFSTGGQTDKHFSSPSTPCSTTSSNALRSPKPMLSLAVCSSLSSSTASTLSPPPSQISSDGVSLPTSPSRPSSHPTHTMTSSG